MGVSTARTRTAPLRRTVRRSPLLRRTTQRLEPGDLARLQLAPGAGLEPFDRQARVAASVQSHDRVADGLAHALDLMLASLVQDQLELRGAETAHVRGRGGTVVELDAGGE